MKIADLEAQYKRCPQISREEVEKLVKWTEVQPHMETITETLALHFFHACECSLERAKEVLDAHLTVRTHVGEFFHNTDPALPEIERAMRTIDVIPLQQPTAKGHRVVISRLSDYNVANFVYADAIKLYFSIFDMWMLEDGIRPGDVIVIDLKGCTLGHVARIGLMQMKKFLYFLQEAAPIRISGLHFVNIVPFMDKIMCLMTPFMKKELKNSMHLHTNLADFHKFVPPALLPKEYGGVEGSCSGVEISEMMYARLREQSSEIVAFQERLRIDEKRRPGKSKQSTDLFGIEGNFKKLDID